MKRLIGDTSSDDEPPFWNDDTFDPGSGSHFLHVPNAADRNRSRSKKSILKPLTEWSTEERAEKLKQQSLTNDFHKFVEGHLILKQGE